MEIEETKTTFWNWFNKSGLIFFLISKFFITKTPLANTWMRKKVPSSSNSSLVSHRYVDNFEFNFAILKTTHLFQTVRPVLKFLWKNLSDGTLKLSKIKLKVFLNWISKKCVKFQKKENPQLFQPCYWRQKQDIASIWFFNEIRDRFIYWRTGVINKHFIAFENIVKKES